MPDYLTTFGKLADDDLFMYDVEGRTTQMMKRKGTSWAKGRTKGVDYNCIDTSNGEVWVFEDEDRVIKL